MVNTNWAEGGIANVVIARKHTNGNITIAIYLVDLLYLGVKDTKYLFNVTEQYYREILNPFDDMDKFMKIEYTLAHNIIYYEYPLAFLLRFRYASGYSYYFFMESGNLSFNMLNELPFSKVFDFRYLGSAEKQST